MIAELLPMLEMLPEHVEALVVPGALQLRRVGAPLQASGQRAARAVCPPKSHGANPAAEARA